ncbi:hypothetical protein ACLKA7_015500 [Drosophila subpalustris]
MLSNKFLVMSFALFAVIIAVSGEEISDRRFRWVGSDEQEPDEKKAEAEEDNADDSDDEEDTDEAQDNDADDNETQDDDETDENNDSTGDNTEEEA